MKIVSIFSLESFPKKLISTSYYLSQIWLKKTWLEQMDSSIYLTGFDHTVLRFNAVNDSSKSIYLKIRSIKEDSIVGNLHGFEIEELGNFSNTDYGCCYTLHNLRDHHCNKVISFGQETEFVYRDRKMIDFWYRKSEIIPESIQVQKRTIDLLAFSFSNGQWIYAYPQSEGSFAMDILVDLPPEKYFGTLFNPDPELNINPIDIIE